MDMPCIKSVEPKPYRTRIVPITVADIVEKASSWPGGLEVTDRKVRQIWHGCPEQMDAGCWLPNSGCMADGIIGDILANVITLIHWWLRERLSPFFEVSLWIFVRCCAVSNLTVYKDSKIVKSCNSSMHGQPMGWIWITDRKNTV